MTITLERDTTKTHTGLPAPDDWHIVGPWGDGLIWERMTGQRLTVIETLAEQSDGKCWLHVSISKPNKKMPTWEDLHTVRTLFVGEDRECYQVFPPKERYVNLGNVLHLYSCMGQEKGVLPQFDGEIEIGGQLVRSI